MATSNSPLPPPTGKLSIELRSTGARRGAQPTFKVAVVETLVNPDKSEKRPTIEEIGRIIGRNGHPSNWLDCARYQYWLALGAVPTTAVAQIHAGLCSATASPPAADAE